MRIALLEDDLDQSTILKAWINEIGHDCTVFNAGKVFLRELKRSSFDLLILDWMLPDVQGIEVLDWVRKNLDWKVPIIFITIKDNEEDIIAALNAGADDYMAKPVKKGELSARLNALLRRFHPDLNKEKDTVYGAYKIIYDNSMIYINDELIELTQKEFELMVFLLNNIGKIISRGHILESVWGASADLNTRTVDTHISRIRTKLSLKGEYGLFLRAVYQHGYRLERLDIDAKHF
ncbi:two-component system OmpR family response regulator [Gammaproteobacteria bacterium]|nr:two-component system OmpR family response regulator [Gammaproteobacteria bacterium]